MASRVLALPAIPASYSGSPEVFCGMSIISIAPRCETAGRAFFERVEARHYTPRRSESASDASAPSAEAATDIRDGRGGKKNHKEHSSIAQRVRRVLESGEDLYAMVCCSDGASTDEIRKQWRKLALLFHPDKAASTAAGAESADELVPGVDKMSPEALHEQFLKRHNAFEILTDAAMRRQYDSYAHFDDRLPGPVDLTAALAEGPEKFFAICRAGFEKEARWCSRLPVPEFGDANTPLAEIQAFYRYWSTYESWRDFANAGEHHLEEAHDREEKRWMQKENWKVVRAKLRAERQRVLNFVHAVEERDPRLKKKVAAPQRLTGAAAKMAALANLKATILARNKKLASGRSAVRSCWKEWVEEKGGRDEALSNRIEKFLQKDENVEAISDMAHVLANVTKRYREPSAEAAIVVKAAFVQQLIGRA